MREFRALEKAGAAEARKMGWRVSAAPSCKSGGEVPAFCFWAEERIRVPTGPLRSQPFRVEPWQREFLQAATAPATPEAGLSAARKNGKSGVVAALLLGYLMGPFRHQQWRGDVAHAHARGGIARCDSVDGGTGGYTADRQVCSLSGLHPLCGRNAT